MADLLIRGARVVGPTGFEARDVAVVDGVIVEDGRPDAPVVDAAGLLAAPGFVDLQCNGAVGIDLASGPERLWELAAALPRWGVTAWLPTIVTGPSAVTDRALATLAAGPPAGWVGAVPLGLHLEGPFLAPGHRGAHRPEHLRPPTIEAVDGWGSDAGVAVVTLAPELPGALEVIEALVARGIVVSLGHSGATAAQARAGIDAGATWVTHLWNAMAPLHHRAPGLVGVALTDERVRVGLIADGIHVDPAVVAFASRALHDRLVLVTDAVSALGLPSGRHRLGTVEVEHTGQAGVRLTDGTLAGSDLAMDQAVRNLIAFSGVSVERALAAASTTPAAVLGDASRGALDAGRRADLVLLDDGLRVVATIVGGAVVHDARG